jgi:hypothetical protein
MDRILRELHTIYHNLTLLSYPWLTILVILLAMGFSYSARRHKILSGELGRTWNFKESRDFILSLNTVLAW